MDGPFFSYAELTTEYCRILGYDAVRLGRIAVSMIRVNYMYQTTWR